MFAKRGISAVELSYLIKKSIKNTIVHVANGPFFLWNWTSFGHFCESTVTWPHEPISWFIKYSVAISVKQRLIMYYIHVCAIHLHSQRTSYLTTPFLVLRHCLPFLAMRLVRRNDEPSRDDLRLRCESARSQLFLHRWLAAFMSITSERSSSCSQKKASVSYSEPAESRLFFPSHLRSGFQSGFFPSGFVT